MDKTPVLRFAPSPTGSFHVGSARTALFNWLYARRMGSKFLLRIEDTDKERSTDANFQKIYSALNWLGIDWDGDIDFQSTHEDRHRAAVEELIAKGLAYRCKATRLDVDKFKEENGRETGFRGSHDGEGAVRLCVPKGETNVFDVVFGKVVFDNHHLDEFVIAREDGTPTYLLASAVDDAHDEITHVVRGADHLSNTPKQILIYNALGHPAPKFVHLPLINGKDGKKLSKRRVTEGDMVLVEDFVQNGILPDAAINYISLLGWGDSDNDTLLSREDLLSKFSLKKVSKNPAQFDTEKLLWVNKNYIKHVDDNVALELLLKTRRAPETVDKELLKTVFNISREKITSLDEFWNLCGFFFNPFVLDPEARERWLENKEDIVEAALEKLAGIEDWNLENLKTTLKALVKEMELSPKEVFQPIRVATTGYEIGPGIFELLHILGKDCVTKRLQQTKTDIA